MFEPVPLSEDSSVTYSIIQEAFASTPFAEFPYENIHHVSLPASPLSPLCENCKRCIFRIKALWVPVIDFLLQWDSVLFPGSKTLSLASPPPHLKTFFCPSSSLRNMLLVITEMQKSNHTFSPSVWALPLRGWNHHRQQGTKRHSLLRIFSLSLGYSWDLRTMGLGFNH